MPSLGNYFAASGAVPAFGEEFESAPGEVWMEGLNYELEDLRIGRIRELHGWWLVQRIR